MGVVGRMTEKRFKSRCYEKQKNVVIYDKGDKLFDVSYRDFEDAYYLKMKLSPVIDKLNELSEENSKLHTQNDFLKDENQHMRDLVNENRQLKQQLEDCKDVNVRCCNDYSAMRRDVWKYKEENEQLKSDNNRLVKQTAETIEKHQQRVLDLIDEKIIECEKAVEDIRYNGKDSYVVKHDVASKLLKELKKELSE